jgi:1-deoxy-D-xylulose-5-phosphate reductoisomerase
MRGSIGFAMNWPDRRELPVERLDLASIGRLEFAPVDTKRFPALRLAREVMESGGLTGAVFNAAKESALDAFISNRIGFLDMAGLVEHVLDSLGSEAAAKTSSYSLCDVQQLDAAARHAVATRLLAIA